MIKNRKGGKNPQMTRMNADSFGENDDEDEDEDENKTDL
jgi:hypothetical protein